MEDNSEFYYNISEATYLDSSLDNEIDNDEDENDATAGWGWHTPQQVPERCNEAKIQGIHVGVDRKKRPMYHR